MRLRSMAVLLVAAAALTACASGGDVRRVEPLRALLSVDALLFSGFDSDDDLRISAAEIEAGITHEWARADANHDASLQPLEFQNWSATALGGGQTPPYRLDFDRNVDNAISAEEFRTEILARAQEYDTDGDGTLTRADLVRQLNQTRPAAPERERREPGPPRV
ncbi:MAG: hypothetical protein WDM79_09895 [Terricaulis sp.]